MRLDHYLHIAGQQALDQLVSEVQGLRRKLDEAAKREEAIMKNLAELQQAVAQAVAYIQTLKAAAENPADQTVVDTAIADLNAATAPPVTPAP